MDKKVTLPVRWLQDQKESIEWKLVCPNIRNPFDSAGSNEKLEEYISDRSGLLALCHIQALMDQTIILRITDLTVFAFNTEHPNLTGLDRDDLREHLRTSGTWLSLDAEVSRFQESCRNELRQRAETAGF